MPKLSIIITALEDLDLPNTLQSIADTAYDRCEVIVVMDASLSPVDAPMKNGDGIPFTVLQTSHRCGVGPCRTIGVHRATGDYVMIIDSHCRFHNGWYEKVIQRLEGRPKTLTCFECRGLDANNMDMDNPKGRYYGATWNVFGPDANRKGYSQFLEPVWIKDKPEDDAEIPAVMGGAYAAHRDWMIKIGEPLRYLRQWAEDENVLSIRSWCLGGDVRIMTTVGIGHRFLLQNESQPYKVAVGYPTSNKLFTLHTLVPDDLRDFLMEKMQLLQGGGELATAKKIIQDNWHLIEVERAKNQVQFVRDFRWICQKFEIPIPI